MVPELLVLAVEFYRAPLRFGHLTDTTQPLPEAFGTWLLESGNAMAAGRVQATASALGIPGKELRDAFSFFLRQILLSPQADHYRALGLSRNCPQASIKRHHQLLVRTFHPDRNPGQNERGIALTARINAAYQILRDPKSRRRYDLSLPPLEEGDRSKTHGRGFFRPLGTMSRYSSRTRLLARVRMHPHPVILWVLACIIVAGLLFTALHEPQQPLLQISPTMAQKATSGPSYLRQTDAGVRQAQTDRGAPEGSDSAPSRAALPTSAIGAMEETPRTEPARAADESAAGAEIGAATAISPGTGAAADVVARFEKSYARGDLVALVSLFTADAISNDGAGLAFVTRAFSDIFASTGERQLSIFNLKWHAMHNQRLLGTGDIRIGIRPASSSDWRQAAGTVELALVPWLGDYKISMMVHRLSRNSEIKKGW